MCTKFKLGIPPRTTKMKPEIVLAQHQYLLIGNVSHVRSMLTKVRRKAPTKHALELRPPGEQEKDSLKSIPRYNTVEYNR